MVPQIGCSTRSHGEIRSRFYLSSNPTLLSAQIAFRRSMGTACRMHAQIVCACNCIAAQDARGGEKIVPPVLQLCDVVGRERSSLALRVV